MAKKLSDDLKLPAGVDAEAVLKAVADVDSNEELQRSNEAISAAKRNLEALLDNSLPALEPVTICDVQFYIKRLGYTDIAKLALSINRDAAGALQLKPKDRKPESIVAKVMILTCVCEEDGSAYFTREDLEKYFDNPQLVEVFTGLMEECNRINPCILNTLKKT